MNPNEAMKTERAVQEIYAIMPTKTFKYIIYQYS